ncbi:hypothetical protein SeLEV6574_g07568 [Synchytrium endobioticum]|uniref:Uncharacterized protein n=1 Tax=Synchytrium endobioticum TaxID=286115 RepID=A0A507CCS3_9FUNG|nr:hypothetical protein SeLEV6574_g07568 [Synchytrium endobioticum]
MWNFFASGFFRILLIQIFIVHRCMDVVAPRNPRRTRATYTASIILRIPLVAYGSRIIRSLSTLIFNPEKADRSNEEVLLSLFIFQCCTYIVEVFFNCLELGPGIAAELQGESPNLFEWAVTWHFNQPSRSSTNHSPTPTPTASSPMPISADISASSIKEPIPSVSSGIHAPPILIIAMLQCLQLCVLNASSALGLQHLRLIPTTFFALLGLTHFVWCVATDQMGMYPMLQWMGKVPELSVISIILIVATLYGAALLITNGAVRNRRIFNTHISLAEDFNQVLYKIGTACLEASQNMGLMRELDPITIPTDIDYGTAQTNMRLPDGVSGFALNDSTRPINEGDTGVETQDPVYPRQRGILRLWITFFRTVVYIMVRGVKFVRQLRQGEAADASRTCDEVVDRNSSSMTINAMRDEWNESLDDPDYLPSESSDDDDDDDDDEVDGQSTQAPDGGGTNEASADPAIHDDEETEESLYKEIFDLANDLIRASHEGPSDSTHSLAAWMSRPLSPLLRASPIPHNAVGLLADTMQEPPIMTRSARRRWEEAALSCRNTPSPAQASDLLHLIQSKRGSSEKRWLCGSFEIVRRAEEE